MNWKSLRSDVENFFVHVVTGIPEGLICMTPRCWEASWMGKQDNSILISLEPCNLLLENKFKQISRICIDVGVLIQAPIRRWNTIQEVRCIE